MQEKVVFKGLINFKIDQDLYLKLQQMISIWKSQYQSQIKIQQGNKQNISISLDKQQSQDDSSLELEIIYCDNNNQALNNIKQFPNNIFYYILEQLFLKDSEATKHMSLAMEMHEKSQKIEKNFIRLHGECKKQILGNLQIANRQNNRFTSDSEVEKRKNAEQDQEEQKIQQNKNKDRTITVAQYLMRRLKELGLKRIFGVAGNYTAPFLNTILEDKEQDQITITGMSNEICAGYAADAYARTQKSKGIGAVHVTYGVGAFSLLNAVAGSYNEGVPIVVINGAPSNREFMNQRQIGLIYQHLDYRPSSNLDVYRNVTTSSQQIKNANEAPFQIDAALSACITQSLPVYIEVLEDVWRTEIQVLTPLVPLSRKQANLFNSHVSLAVDKTLEFIKLQIGQQHVQNKQIPKIWAGVEIQRQELQELLKELLSKTGLQYVTSSLSKSVLSENEKSFAGNITIQKDSVLVGLGGWTTGNDTNNQNIVGDKHKVLISHGCAFIAGEYLANVPLKEFMIEFIKKWTSEDFINQLNRVQWKNEPAQSQNQLIQQQTNLQNEKINYDKFCKILSTHYLCPKETDISEEISVVVDSSFILVTAVNELKIKRQNGFLAQGSWLSIGYSIPAGVGLQCSVTDHGLSQRKHRTVVVSGDGAAQETIQGLSSIAHLKQNTVVFILDNGLYGIVQYSGNPNPFRDKKIDYKNHPIYNQCFEYNQTAKWNYENLSQVFGLKQGRKVENMHQLADVINEIKQNRQDSFIVNVSIEENVLPDQLKEGVDKFIGEDEFYHKDWKNNQPNF